MKPLITGASGQLGLAFQNGLRKKGLTFIGLDHKNFNIVNKRQIEHVLDLYKPTELINCAAYNLVEEAESNRTLAMEINAEAVKSLAQACEDRGIKFIHYSSDYVFDGDKGSPYSEEDATNPLNVYGQSKYEGELSLRLLMEDYLIFRTSWVYGEGRQNFLYKISQWSQKTNEIKVSNDEISVPTYVEDIVAVTLKAIEGNLTGLYHLASSGHASRYEWAKVFVAVSGLTTQITPVPSSQFQLKARRPLFSAMSNEKISKELGVQIPAWQEGVERFVRMNKGK